MKANEAPEKLYLINDEGMVILSYDPLTKLKYGNRYDYVDETVFPIEEGCEVEYTRTDAFIEKATEFLQEHLIDYLWSQGVTDESDFIDDFKNYMKGE